LFNTASFLELTGVPIQVIRVGLAILITFSMIRATQIADDERQRQLVAAQEARLAALRQQDVLRRKLLRRTVIAQEDERARIAHELHDESAQFLTAMTLNLGTIKNYLPADQRVAAIVDQLLALCREMSQGIHRMVHDLRPAQLDDLGLAAALRYLVDEMQTRTGLEVRLEITGERRRLEPLIETVIFRVAQEALVNIARHAGCRQAEVNLVFEASQVRLKVRDEGAGFDYDAVRASGRGLGLAGMRERAESVGGELRLISRPERGTEVEVLIPVLVHGNER